MVGMAASSQLAVSFLKGGPKISVLNKNECSVCGYSEAHHDRGSAS